MGRHTYGDVRVVTWNNPPQKVTVGSFCSIGGCEILLDSDHRVDWITTFPFGHMSTGTFKNFNGVGHPRCKGDVTIGNDVWIGRGVTIMSGVTIGDGAVIAANSHVCKNVEPYTIHGGNPARFIRRRFSEEDTDFLLNLKWWDWPDEKIDEFAPILCSGDIQALRDRVTSSTNEHVRTDETSQG